MHSGHKKTSVVWEHFTDVGGHLARCNVCKKKFSFRTSVSNLKKHYTRLHPTKSVLNQPTDASTSNSDWKPSNNESDAEEPQFNQEVVFLYESDAEKASKAANKPSISPYSQQERERERQERERERQERERERQLEERREERRKERLRRRERMRQTVRRSVHEERTSVADAEELDNFGKYVTCLMRTVPKELSAQLQMDIINLIMTAKIKNMSKPEPSATDNVQTVQNIERFEPVTRASYVQQPIILSYDSSVVNGAVKRSDTAGNTNSMPVISDGNQAI